MIHAAACYPEGGTVVLRYIQRGADHQQPIGDLPRWLSTLLRTRGVDTVEKAERFLHPSLDHMHDPYLMHDMDKAVALIRKAAEEKQAIVVYGDYDVDGVCATTILVETLREMGAQVSYRIPSRHKEGYGLNCDAVREMAEKYKLLITVDCGVTNHEEVRLAQLLGMTVIVTDHHQLAETMSPADAVLNPLIGDYPFRRLCGAGVALKVCQALCGMEAVKKRLEVAALATVADIVPLIDENRVIVHQGLKMMAHTERIGLEMLMRVSDVNPPVNAGHVGFRLAPRLNAGGRLADASQGVALLLTHDRQEAEWIATSLEESNRQRQAIEQEINEKALATIAKEADFLKDKVIIVMDEGWNAGVIGLAAGKICEKYHFPTIVLSRDGDMAVGSCRSIPGVNIHAMLCTCKDLFERFGGHEQAAGLTMRADLVPELKRRLNLAIAENCDETCYIPEKEYDLTLRLSEVDLALIDQLDLMQPTGFGNPAPVFLAHDAHVQEIRRVGRDRSHLKLTLLDGGAVRGGIAFSMGDLADEGLERVDVLFSPERNEYMGRVSAQLSVKAIRPAEGSAPLPAADAFFRANLQEITQLAENYERIDPPFAEADAANEAAVRKLLRRGRGTLLIAHERGRAAVFASDGMVDVKSGRTDDPRAFNTLLCGAELDALNDVWQDIVLLDGDTLPGEMEAIRIRCPRAKLWKMRENPAWTATVRSLKMDRAAMGKLYVSVKAGQIALSGVTAASGMTMEQALTGLTVLAENGLIEFSPEPFAVRIIAGAGFHPLDESRLYRYLHGIN